MLTIIRGIPGSGKSTLAKLLATFYAHHGKKVAHYEADMFFTKDSEYTFDASKLKNAHEWCRHCVDLALVDHNEVIVSNTFTTYKEIEPYIEMAYIHKIPVHIIHCTSKFESIHNVPDEAMKRMRNRFVSNEHIVDSFKELFNIEHDAPGFEISHQTHCVTATP